MTFQRMLCRWLLVPMAFLCAAAFADTLPLNQIPMYGEGEKTDAMKQADTAFIVSVEQMGLSHEEGAKRVVRSAWAYWAKQDYTTAIKRFNQAWLLDPENGDAYHGFALVTAVRNGAPDQVERFFKLAVSKPNVEVSAFVDYGRFLWTQKQLDASLVQLNKALQLSQTARNARSHISFVYYLKGDSAKACLWAKDAASNGDTLEAGYLEDMCGLPKPKDAQSNEKTGGAPAPN